MISALISFISGELETIDFLLELFAFAVVIVCCFPIHESAHAWAADRLGDPTGRLSGRIDMNPAAHLSLLGTVCMVLFGVGYAKPVPVNIRNFPFDKRKKYFALTAVAGPVSNLLLGTAAIVIKKIFFVVYYNSGAYWAEITVYLFSIIAYINITLAVFNLLPFPPLDGSRIWTMLLPDRYYYKVLQYERYLMYALLAAVFIFNRIGFSPVSLLSELIYGVIDKIIGIPFSFFF